MAVPIGVVLVWLGYSVVYYGYNRITGGNNKFVDLIYPGRYHAVARDDGSGAPSASSAASSSSKPPKVPKSNFAAKGQHPNAPPVNKATAGKAGAT